jgi:hypothetical protein
VADKFPDRVQSKSFGSITYYQGPQPMQIPAVDANARPNPDLRRPEPLLAIVGDYLMITGSVKMLERVVVTQSDGSGSLANELDYKLIADRVKRHSGGVEPGMVTFQRPEKGFQLLYDLANSDDTRRVLSARADENGFFRTLNDALQNNPLPPFSELSKYLAPGGGMLTNDETGFHYTTFSLKRE